MRAFVFTHSGEVILYSVLCEASCTVDACDHVRSLACEAFAKGDHAFIAVLSDFVMPMLHVIGPSSFGARVPLAMQSCASNSNPDLSLAERRKNWVNDHNQ